MTAVQFHRVGRDYLVTFSYDATLVAVVKTVPARDRSWNPEAKEWRISAAHAHRLAASMRQLGCTVVGLESEQQSDAGNWAHLLFQRVGPARSGAVFRSLSRILHPDTATGDKRLQQELNAAHLELGRNQ